MLKKEIESGIKKNIVSIVKSRNGKKARHLERKHGSEIDVAKALSYPKGSKTRRHYLTS